MNKKGIFSISLFDHMFFFVLIVLPFMMVFFFFLSSIANTVEAAATGILPGLESQVYQNRMILSDNCFAHSKNGRVYPGVIDPDKLTNERLALCLPLLTSQERALTIDIVANDQYVKLETPNYDPMRRRTVIEMNHIPVNLYGQGSTIMTVTHYS